jgi:predicted methyltransferase
MSLKKNILLVVLVGCGSSTPATKTPDTQTQSAAIDLGPAPQDDAARLDWAIAGAQRSAQERARDKYRHPKETLSFFGIKDTMHVVELWPGGGWYTEVLAPYLRDSGKLSATNFDPAKATGEQKEHAETFEKKLASAPSVFGKVEVLHIAPPGDISLGPDESADMVVTFRNLHNWIGGKFADKVLASAFKVLKHGGILGVEEHRGDPGEDEKTIDESGYVPEQKVIDLAQAAGFKLDGKSEVNANPKDDHKHEGGVWALPPALRNGDKDRDKYTAIGESDRMTLKFVKP